MSYLNKSVCLTGLLIIGAFITACGENTSNEPDASDPDPVDEDYSIEEVTEEVPRSTHTFGWNLFDHVLKENDNRLISPMSISVALSMTMAGADGETKQEIADALTLNDLDDEDINASFRALIHLLEDSDADVDLSIANSIWKRDDYVFEDDFIQTLETHYEAQIEPLTNNDPINDWISDQTNGLIEDMIDEIPSCVVMYLINAVYFNGSWTEPFEENMTSEGTFTTSSGENVDVMMMQKGEKEPSYLYGEHDAFQAVSLPYGEDERWSMNVILPDNDEGSIQETIEFLREEEQPSFSEKSGLFRLPRFKMEDDMSLNNALIELGMPQAFDGGKADFSRMTQDTGLFISEVLHETYIEVDEEGTEAAAATSVDMNESEPAYDFEMIVDRPFMFTIQDNETGTLLFIGYVNEPGV